MVKMQVCRICLVKDLGTMYSIAGTPLEDIYQSLTGMLFVTKDIRPLQVCYICRGRLISCHRLKMNCLRSEELFSHMMISNVAIPQLIPDIPRMRLAIHNAITLSNVPEAQADLKYHVKQEPVEFSHTVEVKQENVEDFDDWNIEHDEAQCSIPSTETDEINALKLSLEVCGSNFTPELLSSKGTLTEAEKKLKENLGKKKEQSQPFKETNQISKMPKRSKYKRSNNNKKKPYICEVCNKCYSTQAYLTRHLHIHIGEVTYKCDVCDKCFASKNTLQSHSCLHNGENQNQSKMCKNKTHTRIKAIKCEICGYAFSSMSDLKPHMRTHTGEKPFQCDICNKCFSIKKNLKRHTLVHVGEKPYKCSICSKCFTVKYNLEVHIRRHTGEKPFKCEVCNDSFVTKFDLQSHLLLHNIGKTHKCNLCSKCFKSRSQLIRHIRIHSGEKTHQCEVCNKCFTRKADLKVHSRLHIKNNKYSTKV